MKMSALITNISGSKNIFDPNKNLANTSLRGNRLIESNCKINLTSYKYR